MKGVRFGQFVVGSPGAGKSSYCKAVQAFLATCGRPCVVVNLDPGNVCVPYVCAVDVCELVRSDEAAQRQHALGPNGALLLAMETVAASVHSWLLPRLAAQAPDAGTYVLFDCPGQIELFTHHAALKTLLEALQGPAGNMRLCCVALVEAHHLADASKYVSLALVVLTTMLQLELPHVSVLSKADLLEQFGPLPLGLDYYAEARDLRHALELDKKTLPPKYVELNEALAELIEDFCLVQFTALNVADVQNLAAVIRLADKACGYVYRSDEMNDLIAKAQADLDLAEMHELYKRKDK